MNNVKLARQVAEKIRTKFREQVQRDPQGQLKLFVRGSEVRKTYELETVEMVGVEPPEGKGLKPIAFSNFVELVAMSLKRYKPYDYGHLYINYEATDNGNDFRMSIRAEKETHYN
ncbi:hypothetical protein J2S74_002967 [Evansella vedderi]|uniref:Uncharacterized protein n=1 Tax=Evansella vedderi TaxID=38282 RepID=A0ABT9ZWI5_9BACI|nr:hypothetical protein [Evansella vedderi]MDQ0255585.1 hypothetical protein [Evansella vedderi]